MKSLAMNSFPSVMAIHIITKSRYAKQMCGRELLQFLMERLRTSACRLAFVMRELPFREFKRSC